MSSRPGLWARGRHGTALQRAAALLARSLGLPDGDVRAAYYTALLHHSGCVGYAHETAMLFQDELVANRAAGRTDAGSARDLVMTFLPILTHGRPPLARLRLLASAITRGSGWGRDFTATACELGRDTADSSACRARCSTACCTSTTCGEGRPGRVV